MAQRKGPTRARVRVESPDTARAELEVWRRGRDRANEHLAVLVTRARSAGLTWADVGRALGTTGQAAHKRFREVDPGGS